jgi:hypothetical protein
MKPNRPRGIRRLRNGTTARGISKRSIVMIRIDGPAPPVAASGSTNEICLPVGCVYGGGGEDGDCGVEVGGWGVELAACKILIYWVCLGRKKGEAEKKGQREKRGERGQVRKRKGRDVRRPPSRHRDAGSIHPGNKKRAAEHAPAGCEAGPADAHRGDDGHEERKGGGCHIRNREFDRQVCAGVGEGGHGQVLGLDAMG